MSLISMLTIKVAGPAVKAIVRLAMPDNIPGGEVLGEKLGDLLDKRISNFSTQWQSKGLLRTIQGDVAISLETAIATEFPNVQPYDSEAAALAVGEILDSSKISEIAVECNLDGVELFRRLQKAGTGRFESLGGDSKNIAEFLLRETCVYLIGLAERLPDFRLNIAREMLERTDELRTDLLEVLLKLDSLRNKDDLRESNDESTFLTDYRRILVKQLDRLQLFGIRQISELAKNYPLSISYVSVGSRINGEVQSQGAEASIENAY
jgi:hypothetical protein